MTDNNKAGVRPLRIEWERVFEYFLFILVLPTLILWYAGWHVYQVLPVMYYLIITLFMVQALMSYASCAAGAPRHYFVRPEKHRALPDTPVPKSTFIVCAYLPNEVDVLEETLLNLLQNVERPEADIEVILAYNTPAMQDIENRLRALAREWPQLILANAYESRSKVENLNYALELASGEIICLLDADHRVAGDCLSRAWRWLGNGADAVQGRCKIRNGSHNFLTSLVEVEFEIIYGIQHQAKSMLFNTALFGGSNGYWQAAVLKKLRFNSETLTEDIDTTLRALEQGYTIIHDRSIISSELAPESAAAFWYQRKRWAQGWFACTWRHQIPIWRSPHLRLPAKFMWTWLLAWRVFYDALAVLLIPVVLAYWGCRGTTALPVNAYVIVVLALTLASGPVEALASVANAAKPRYPFYRAVKYAIMVLPYTLFQHLIKMVAIRDYFAGNRKWVITSHQIRDTEQEVES